MGKKTNQNNVIDLKKNFVTQIQNVEEGFVPILQVLDIKKSSTERYLILLSDGTVVIQSIFSLILVDYFMSKKIENGSLVQINSFTFRSTQYNKFTSYTQKMNMLCTTKYFTNTLLLTTMIWSIFPGWLYLSICKC
jgi:hypothetical protein